MEENGSTVALQAGLPFTVEEFSPLKTLHFLPQPLQIQHRAHPLCPERIVSLLTPFPHPRAAQALPQSAMEFVRALLCILSMMPMVSWSRACASWLMFCTLLPCSPSAGPCPILLCSSEYSSFTCPKAWPKANKHCR